MDEHSLIRPSGERFCSICLKPCQGPATQQPCSHSFCLSCSNRSWGDELKQKVTCPGCRETLLRNKPGKMEETARLTTVDETKQPAQSICEIHKESLNLFCVEDQAPLCSVCRKSWDHSSHTVIPRREDSFPRSEPSSSRVIGHSDTAPCVKGNGEALGGTEKDDTLMLIGPRVDFNLEENKEEGTPSTSRVHNSITWILLILFIIQIVGLVTTILVFTQAKAELPAAVAPCCPSGWVANQGNCYQVLQLEGSWDAGRDHCSSLGASLAVVADLGKLNVAMQDKGPFDHWVGLLRESGGSWKWTDGTVLNNLFEVKGDGGCAYLSEGVLASADCSAEKKWICSWKARARGGSHRPCWGT